MEEIHSFIDRLFEYDLDVLRFERKGVPYDSPLQYSTIQPALWINSRCLYKKQEEWIEFKMIDDFLDYSSDKWIENAKKLAQPEPRRMYKISEYDESRYGKVWLVYTSDTNPKIDRISTIFVLAKRENEIAIISELYPVANYQQWKTSQGDRGLKWSELGEPIDVHRYKQPTDERSIQIYNEQK